MFRSLHMKLTLILLLLISSLMAVVGAFLTTSVSSFYINSFYQQMDGVFGQDNPEFYTALCREAARPGGLENVQEMLEGSAGSASIFSRRRRTVTSTVRASSPT